MGVDPFGAVGVSVLENVWGKFEGYTLVSGKYGRKETFSRMEMPKHDRIPASHSDHPAHFRSPRSSSTECSNVFPPASTDEREK